MNFDLFPDGQPNSAPAADSAAGGTNGRRDYLIVRLPKDHRRIFSDTLRGHLVEHLDSEDAADWHKFLMESWDGTYIGKGGFNLAPGGPWQRTGRYINAKEPVRSVVDFAMTAAHTAALTPDKAAKDKRTRLLEHYATRKPKRFIQYDGHVVEHWDDFMMPDRDGHSIMSTETQELMAGAAVRVLIEPGTPRETVITLLGKISNAIRDKGLKDERGDCPPGQGYTLHHSPHLEEEQAPAAASAFEVAQLVSRLLNNQADYTAKVGPPSEWGKAAITYTDAPNKYSVFYATKAGQLYSLTVRPERPEDHEDLL